MTVPILVAAFVFLGSVAPISQTPNREQGAGQVAGVITDITGARVVRARIALDGDGIAYSTTSADDGAYSLSVKPGIYRIEVRSPGFCTDRRARFRIEPQSKAIFDFILHVCPIVNRLITVTYNLLTISADEVSFGKKSFELIAKGNVIVQEGARRFEAGSVRVNFTKGVADVKAY